MSHLILPGMLVFTTWSSADGKHVTFLEGDGPPEGDGWRLMFAIHGPSYEAALAKCRITLGLDEDPRWN